MDKKRKIYEREIENFCQSYIDGSDRFCSEGKHEECPLYESFLTLKNKERTVPIEDLCKRGNSTCGLIGLIELKDAEIDSLFEHISSYKYDSEAKKRTVEKGINLLDLIKRLTLARNSFSNENYEKAKEQYAVILEIDPSCEEAEFYLEKIEEKKDKD